MKFSRSSRVSCLCLSAASLLWASVLQAQHAGHRGGGHRADSSGIVAQTDTQPEDDAVLGSAPVTLQLHFPDAVRLVKLTLHNEQRDWVDINFRYNPRPGIHYSLDLPPLQQAAYYTADWAILGDNDQLIRGSFSFTFGTDAEAPSLIKAEEELLLRPEGLEPGARFVAPPPTQIIIDRTPRDFDPPFTIELNPDNN